MSRAFVKEPDGDQFVDDQPELPISQHRNLVTPAGLVQLTEDFQQKSAAREVLSKDNTDKQHQLELNQLDRELRYLQKRLETAEVVKTDQNHQHDVALESDIVSFGATVTILDIEAAALTATDTAASEAKARTKEKDKDKNSTQKFTIVGEDEADIEQGKISWVSPLAKALLDRSLGDEVIWHRPMGDLEIEIVAIEYPATE